MRDTRTTTNTRYLERVEDRLERVATGEDQRNDLHGERREHSIDVTTMQVTRRSARRRDTMPAGMPSLADVFRVLNEMRSAGRIDQYAIGGATAVLFYAEPARTYDLDVFVILPAVETGLIPLAGVYEWTGARGFCTLGEHVLIYGVPVQFLPAHNPLVEEAIAEARDLEYEDVKVRVVGPEHLVALALQTGGARRRERAWQLIEGGQLDRDRLRVLLARHGISAAIPDDV